MATRTQKIQECDRALCRRRKGVDGIVITVEREFVAGVRYAGELCPLHRMMLDDFLGKLFTNTKEYDNGTEQPESAE